MSEYQYYEFAAIDRPLTSRQQAELRSCSSRATITAGSFINEYHWGDLKGDPLDWMRRHFDAHVYSANWGCCRLMLRLPADAVDRATLDTCCQPSVSEVTSCFVDAFEVQSTRKHCLIEWRFDDDSGEHQRFRSQTDGPDWMARLQPLRDELLRGDTRPLYIGWLARVRADQLGDDDIEPPLPAGLQDLTAAQQALAEFLEIDPDWLNAAAAASPPLSRPAAPEYDTWLALRTEQELRVNARLLLEGRGQEAERTLRSAFFAWEASRRTPGERTPRRRLEDIAQDVTAMREQRLERERQERAAIEAERQTERRTQLAELVENSEQRWQQIDTQLQRGTGLAYDCALHLTQELAEALSQNGRESEFRRGLVRLLATHGKRPAWVARLEKAGLLHPA